MLFASVQHGVGTSSRPKWITKPDLIRLDMETLSNGAQTVFPAIWLSKKGGLEGFCYNVSQIWKWQESNGLARTRTTALLNHGNNGNMSHTHKLSTFPPVCQLLTILMTAESSMRSFCASIWYFTAAPLSGIDTDEVEQKHVKARTRDLLKITVKSAKQKVHRSSTDPFFCYFDFFFFWFSF